MAYIAHQIRPKMLTDKVSKKLKQICQSWTRLDDDLYVVHHSDALKDVCPACQFAKDTLV